VKQKAYLRRLISVATDIATRSIRSRNGWWNWSTKDVMRWIP
jgi:hypothetical protein